jgi:dihydroorotate dehydrogenase
MKNLAYAAFRSLAFRLPPEPAHTLTLRLLALTARPGRPHWLAEPATGRPVRAFGLDFPNPVGLAAGLDKNGDYIDALGSLGFGFLELGTVTPRPQPGNPRPRLFRLPAHGAIINRMGFNNKGVDHLVERVRHASYNGIIGVNIGKNFDTPVERAAEDYLTCLERAWPVADYIAVNISSPNTKNLRDLQGGDHFDDLLARLRQRQVELRQSSGKSVPLLVKIAPDLEYADAVRIADALLRHRMDGVIATNTTVGREGVENSPLAAQTGGLSGRPVREKSDAVVRVLASELRGRLPIIGVGGIFSGADARAKREAGAALVQLYTGFVYQGPRLISESIRAWDAQPEEVKAGSAGMD